MKYPANASGGQGETVTSTYLPQMAINSLSGTSLYVQSTQYDAAGRLTLRVLGANTLRTTQSYYAWNEINGQGRLHFLQTETTTNPPTSLQNLAYVYDAVGNVLTITDQNAGGVQTQTFTYDSLNRLTSASATGGSGGIYASEAYTYDDASGNLSSKAGVAYTYGEQFAGCADSKPHAVTSAGSAIFCYDANGNMTQKIAGSTTTSYTYDAENRMTAVSGAATATFVYDGDGNRVKGVVGGVTTTYIGNYFEWTGSTATMKKYYYAGGARVAERKGTTLYWLLSDHLGSTSITATSSGSKTAELRYKAWGETRYTYGTTQTTIRYTGQREEASLGLYWYASRWYSASLGRFVSPDTIIPQPGNPQAWDRYSYVFSNPVRNVDPSGHKACDNRNESGNCLTDDQQTKEWLVNELENFNQPDIVNADEMIEVGFIITDQLSPNEYNLLLDKNGSLDTWLLFQMYLLQRKAFSTTSNLFPTMSQHNDPADAFRHAYWSALLTNEFGEEFAENFGTAHETAYSPYPNREEVFMDLHNNEIGRDLATNSPNVNDNELQLLILDSLQNGDLYVWDGNGIYFSNMCALCIIP